MKIGKIWCYQKRNDSNTMKPQVIQIEAEIRTELIPDLTLALGQRSGHMVDEFSIDSAYYFLAKMLFAPLQEAPLEEDWKMGMHTYMTSLSIYGLIKEVLQE